ncbi:unnamed protein product, partial [Urochloa humidicola]
SACRVPSSTPAALPPRTVGCAARRPCVEIGARSRHHVAAAMESAPPSPSVPWEERPRMSTLPTAPAAGAAGQTTTAPTAASVQLHTPASTPDPVPTPMCTNHTSSSSPAAATTDSPSPSPTATKTGATTLSSPVAKAAASTTPQDVYGLISLPASSVPTYVDSRITREG